jgi:hypothetical protein
MLGTTYLAPMVMASLAMDCTALLAVMREIAGIKMKLALSYTSLVTSGNVQWLVTRMVGYIHLQRSMRRSKDGTTTFSSVLQECM